MFYKVIIFIFNFLLESYNDYNFVDLYRIFRKILKKLRERVKLIYYKM